MVTTGNWDYKEGVLHLYNPTGSNRAFTIEKCSKTTWNGFTNLKIGKTAFFYSANF